MIGKRKAARHADQSERTADLLAEVNDLTAESKRLRAMNIDLRALAVEMLSTRRPTAAQRDEWWQRAGIPEDAPS